MRQWLIYKHTSERSGKSYIGLTSKTIEERWKEHCSDSIKGSDTHFHRALRLYGTGNWTHEILASDIDTLEEACTLEKYHIKKYDTFENGYNSTLGGDSPVRNQKTEEKRLKNLTEATRKRYKKVEQEFWSFGLNVKISGISGDVEKLLNLPKGVLSSVSTGAAKSRYGISLYTTYLNGYNPNKEVYEFEHKDFGVVKSTIEELCKSYSNLRYSNVHGIATGIDKTYKGWTLKGNQHLLDKTGLDPKSKTVHMLDTNSNETYVFKSLTQASKFTGLHRHSIRDAAVYGRKLNQYIVTIKD